ncbi:1-aminocyclopropane-1-carboxylate oxidase-like 12, partial [Glycine soja]
IHDVLRDDVVGKLRYACEKWGFFQVINHGIPSDVLDEMIKGTGRFHQQDAKARKEYYTRDPNRKVVYVSNYSLYHDPAATWRDTLCCVMTPHPPEAGELSAQQIGGLQVLHDNQWVDVTPIHGALVINIGDLLQLLTNDKFISVKHRVLANHIGPRISVASLFRKDGDDSLVYGPNKELLSEVNPPLYRDVSLKEYLTYYYAKGIGTSGPSHF